MSKFLVWRVALYVVFIVFAAPIEYHTHWLQQLTSHPFTLAIQEPLRHGELYFYSVILITEALFRIEMHPEIPVRWEIQVFKVFLYVLYLPFFVFLVLYQGGGVGGYGVTFESYDAIASILISSVIFLYIHVLDKAEKNAVDAKAAAAVAAKG